MRFFSANKFLVLILLAVVVVGGGLLIANSKANSKVEAIKMKHLIRLLSAFRSRSSKNGRPPKNNELSIRQSRRAQVRKTNSPTRS